MHKPPLHSGSGGFLVPKKEKRMDAEMIKVLKAIKDELHAMRKAMEPKEVTVDGKVVAQAIRDRLRASEELSYMSENT